MATIPTGTIPNGADSWLSVPSAPGERRLVLGNSSPTQPRTLLVRSKKLPKTAARPFDVMQVTVTHAAPFPVDELATAWMVDNASITISMPLVNAVDNSFGQRLSAALIGPLVYFVGGADNTEFTALANVLSDTIANQLTLGLI